MSENIRAAVGSARKKNKEREGAVSAAFLSVISGRSMALIGPEGTGRETMISDVCGTVDGKKMDKHMISMSTSKDEIISKVTKDAVAIILNDVFKANSGTMNLIADIIDDPQRATVFGSSADVPSEADEAHSLYDRFLLRAFIGPLHSDETFLSSINDKRDGTATSKISSGDIEKIRNAAVDVTAEDEVLSAILSLRELFKNTGRYVSDGRWKDSVSTIRIAAAAVGERTAGISFMPLLQHILWDDPEDIDDVRASVLMMCTPGGLELNGLYAGSEHLL
ncbi:MAG: hypothetical protein LBE47_02260, partial [Methanomassiliicoccaceae archaeon]|nr:hypothetical protein [Methanomassiliicoccaceae archaeon]